MKIGLFIPCYVDAVYPEVGVATYKLLKHLGIDVTYPENQTCCGQPMANAGFEKQATPLAEKFEEKFKGFDYVVSPSVSCTAFIRLNAMRPIKVGDVAQHCRVSLRLLELRFKAILNHGVRDEIENVRLANVKQMLRETSLSIKEIGYRCGFQSPASLCTVFRRKFQTSPQAWRREEYLGRKALQKPTLTPALS